MYGTGLTKVALLASHPDELRHFMLQRLIRRAADFTPDSFYYGLTSEPGLVKEMEQKGVKAVVPLGEWALLQATGHQGLPRWRGRVLAHPHVPGAFIVPTFNPSDLLPRRSDEDEQFGKMRHPPRFQGTWIWDVKRAITVARDGFQRHPVTYWGKPDVPAFTQWIEGYEAALAADPETLLSWDIETPYKLKQNDESEYDESLFDDMILRISFSYKPYDAISVPWSGEMREGIRRLLRSLGGKVVWNGSTFDVPKVIANDEVVNGTVFDYMDAWHVLHSDLDKGLEVVTAYCTDLLPWKHLAGEEPEIYSCIDADAALRNALHIRKALQAEGMWSAFMRHAVRLMPILYRAGVRGNLIDIEKQTALKQELDALKAEFRRDAQGMVPRSIRLREMRKTAPPALPDPELRYVPQFAPYSMLEAVASDATEWEVKWEPEQRKVCSACGQFASNKSEHFKGSVEALVDELGAAVLDKKGKPKTKRLANPCKAAGGDIILKPAYAPRFYEVLPFNPGSPDQVKSYIRYHGHPMGRDVKDASKETSGAKHLKDLQKKYKDKHPLYALLIENAKVSKTRGTYCPTPDALGLIHTTYKNSPSTWRLGSANINMQNWGKREQNPYAKKARKTIIARPGHKLVQIDSASVEAVMLGWFMGDRKYMALASKGIHAWLTAMELGLEFTKANIDLIKSEHVNLYNSFKVANHMTNYGGGPGVLYASAPEVFGSKAGAARVQNRIFELLPTLFQFHHEVRVRAQKETFLRNPWGHKHYFYDVFTTDKSGQTKYGKDSKRCVAYLPQSSNGCFQRDNILLLAASPIEGPVYTDIHWVMAHWDELAPAIDKGETWARYFPANLSVHDSGCLDTPVALVERLYEEVLIPIFTRPIPEMAGLRIGAEVEIGDNWGAMDSVKKVVIDDYEEDRKAA